MCPQKRTKKIMIFVFFDLLCSFCCFCRIWLTKYPQTENKKEQKRSCRRESCKMSFVFFVVGPPPPPRKQCFLASDWSKFKTLPRRNCTLSVKFASNFVILLVSGGIKRFNINSQIFPEQGTLNCLKVVLFHIWDIVALDVLLNNFSDENSPCLHVASGQHVSGLAGTTLSNVSFTVSGSSMPS